MVKNPYGPPASLSEVPHATKCETTVGVKIGTIVASLTLIVACVAATWILAMTGWICKARPPESYVAMGVLSLWIIAPYGGSAVIAVAFHRFVGASLITFLGTAAHSALGSMVLYNDWRFLFHAPVPGMRGPMYCGPPMELFFPIFQWIVVAITACVAVFVSFVAPSIIRATVSGFSSRVPSEKRFKQP